MKLFTEECSFLIPYCVQKVFLSDKNDKIPHHFICIQVFQLCLLWTNWDDLISLIFSTAYLLFMDLTLFMFSQNLVPSGVECIESNPLRITYKQIKVTGAMLWAKTSEELRMLSRSLSVCKSLLLNVMIQVSQFVSNSQLCHKFTKSLSI